MRKILALILLISILLTISLPITAFADYSIPSYVRIGLFYGGTAKNSLTVSSDNGFHLGYYEGTEFNKKESFKVTELNIEITENSITASNKLL